jgi:hypothetical protein
MLPRNKRNYETMHSRLAATILLDYWNLRAAIKFSLSKVSIFSTDRLIGHSRAADAAKELAAAHCSRVG